MATHFSILAWKIPQTGEPGWLQYMAGCKELDLTAIEHARMQKLAKVITDLTINKTVICGNGQESVGGYKNQLCWFE